MGDKIWSWVQWWEEVEKSTKYVHDSEKSPWEGKSMAQSKRQTWPSHIQECQVDFYKNNCLQSRESEIRRQKTVYLKTGQMLYNESKHKLEGNIDMLEVFSALKNKRIKNKSPSPDGIPAKFYKLYWPTIGENLLDVFCTGLDDGTLPHSQYVSIIRLLYEKGPREDIRNWKPGNQYHC